MLVVLNFVFIFYYIGVQPHKGPKSLFYREAHNEALILTLSYIIFIFTEFMKYGLYGIEYFGYVFVICVLELFFVNIGYIFYAFMKSMETFETAIDPNTLLILTTDNELFKYINQPQ